MAIEQTTENVFQYCDLLIATFTDGGVDRTAVFGNERGRIAINGIIDCGLNWGWGRAGQEMCEAADVPQDWRVTGICLPRLEREGLVAQVPGVAEIGFHMPDVASAKTGAWRTRARLGLGAKIFGGPDLRVIIYDDQSDDCDFVRFYSNRGG